MPLAERAELIAEMCRSKVYNTEFTEKAVINKCNLFLDDAVKEHWNVALPRHSESKFWSERYPGWKDRPMKASALDAYFGKASEISESGVKKVSHKEAASLTNQGELVIALGQGHATIFAPGANWPTVYRSDLSYRGEDQRIKVGIRPGSSLNAFHIGPEKYREFRKAEKLAKPGE